ncbi:MAG: protein kinase [Pseudomonadota bacterium]
MGRIDPLALRLLTFLFALLWTCGAYAIQTVGVAPVQGNAKYPLVMQGLRQVLWTDLEQTGMLKALPIQISPESASIANLPSLVQSAPVDTVLLIQFIEGTSRFTVSVRAYDAETRFNVGSRSIEGTYGEIRLFQDRLFHATAEILRTPVPEGIERDIVGNHTTKVGAIQALGEADTALREKRYVDALEGLARARSIDPRFRAPKLQLEIHGHEWAAQIADPAQAGRAYAFIGDAKKSTAAFDRALARDARNVAALVGRGDFLLQMKKPAEALPYYQRAAQSDPKNAWAQVGLARAFQDLRRADESLASYERARQLGATSPDVYEALGALYSLRRNTKAAVEAYQTAGELAERVANFSRAQEEYARANRITRSAPGLEKEADLYLAENELPSAISTYAKAVALEPNRDAVWAKSGWAFYLNRQPAEAVRRLRRAYELNPSGYEANLYLGRVLLQSRQTRQEAIPHLETAVRLRPDEVQTQYLLSRAYLDEGHVDAAVGLLEKLVKLDPRNARAHKELADAYAAKEDTARAEIEYARAVEINADLREAHEALAQLYLKTGRREDAVAAIQRVYRIDASDNIFVDRGSELLRPLVSQDLMNLVRKFPKMVPSAVGRSPINQVSVVDLSRADQGLVHRIYSWFWPLYQTDARRAREDFELALQLQYQVIAHDAVSKTVGGSLTSSEFANESLATSKAGRAHLDGLFLFELSGALRNGETTAVTVAPILFSAINKRHYPSSREGFAAQITYPTAEILHLNLPVVIRWLLLICVPILLVTSYLAYKSSARGKGKLRVLINYDPRLESFLTLKLAKKQEEERDPAMVIVRDKEKYERGKYKKLLRQHGTWVRRMVGRDTVFEKVPAREYFCYLYGTIEDKHYLKKTIGNYFMVQKVLIRKDATATLTFQLEKEEAFTTVFVTKGEEPVAGAEIRVKGHGEAVYSRAEAGAFIYLPLGETKIQVSHEGRTIERSVLVRSLDDQMVQVDLRTADEAEAEFVGGRDLREVAEEYRSTGRLEEAAKYLEKAGDTEKAEQLRAEVSLSEGDLDTAAEQLVKAKEYSKAAEMFRRMGKHERADYLYGMHNFAQGDFAKALEFLRDSEDHGLLAKIHEKLGDSRSALLEKAKDHSQRGEKVEAAAAFALAEAHSEAADLYESLDDLNNAADQHAKDGNYLMAGEMFARAGDPTSAAAAFEKGGHFEQAVSLFKDLNDMPKVIALLERQGLFYDAAVAYRDQGMPDEAISMCQKIPSHHDDFPRTQLFLANLFAEKGQDDLALKTFDQAMVANAGAMDADSLYAYAALLERHGDYAKALDLYEEILKKDFQYKDAGARAELLRPKVREAALNAEASKDTRYELLDELGRGAMGVVYRAKDKMLDRIVAFKTLPHTLKDDPSALESLMKEAQTAAKLNHPNIVTVYDIGEEAGNFFMAMEYVEGKTLKEVLKQIKKVNVESFKFVAKALCDVVAYAHEHHVIHRDIKPSNIILLPSRTVKLMDFGLAKVLRNSSSDKTSLRGTPLYMSPEQVLGKDIDHRTDIYSLGILFYEMLAGRTPFKEGDVLYAHVHTPAPPIQEFAPNAPEAVARTIMSCLEKDKTKRPATAKDLAKGLGI